MSLHPLPHLTVETGEHPDAAVIWLHGLGADGHDFEPVVSQLGLAGDSAIRFIFPHAPAMPVTINGGYIMPAWYDIRQSDLGIEHDHQGIARSSDAIRLLIEQEQMRGIAHDRIILAGFSQGAAMALHVGLRRLQPLAGIMALSGYLLLPELQQQFSIESRSSSIFIAHGVHDPIVPYALGENSRHKLEALGYPVEWHSYPIEHNVCPEEIRHIGNWIKRVFAARSS